MRREYQILRLLISNLGDSAAGKSENKIKKNELKRKDTSSLLSMFNIAASMWSDNFQRLFQTDENLYYWWFLSLFPGKVKHLTKN